MILLVDSEGSDQTVQMHRLIWAFTAHMPEDMFSHGIANIIIVSFQDARSEAEENIYKKLNQRIDEFLDLGINFVFHNKNIEA